MPGEQNSELIAKTAIMNAQDREEQDVLQRWAEQSPTLYRDVYGRPAEGI